ncbi:MAG: DUF3891 family protein [Rhodospirillales bacterium]|jgi:hypothetical protein|nr:DUF3891 family protein [Rhodospirillales bacterium]
MIIQSVPEGQESGKRFVIKLAEHLELVGQFAENFGNDRFQAPEPREEFLYVCRWHDKGWQDLDDNPPLNPDSGLPYNLVETPLPVILLTSARSPEHNEARHPYCGLIDSMHIWGLYNGRYGMSDNVPLNSESDTSITIRPLDGDSYSLEPYPFRESAMEVSFQGRYLSPVEAGGEPDMAAVMRDTPPERQSATLIAA